MTRRQTIATVLAGLVTAKTTSASLDQMQEVVQIIQKPVDAGLLTAAVLHVQRGTETFSRTFATATPDSMFLLGSITKPFTAVAVMILVDRGEVNLSDRVVKYLPEFGEGTRKDITIEQLLTHTSGLPDQLDNNNELRARHAPLTEFVKGAVRTPLLFTPGTKYHYQSMGILLAAEIVERVAKQSLPAFLLQHVFMPLGMKRTVLGLGAFKKSEMVPMQTEHAARESGGGDPTASEWDWNSDYWRNLAAPWGGAHSTAADMTAFLRSFLHPDGKVLGEKTAQLMIQDRTASLGAHRGIGFMTGAAGLGKGCSARAFGHSGSTGTLAWADPATDTSFVLLTSLPKNASGDTILYPASDLVLR